MNHEPCEKLINVQAIPRLIEPLNEVARALPSNISLRLARERTFNGTDSQRMIHSGYGIWTAECKVIDLK